MEAAGVISRIFGCSFTVTLCLFGMSYRPGVTIRLELSSYSILILTSLVSCMSCKPYCLRLMVLLFRQLFVGCFCYGFLSLIWDAGTPSVESPWESSLSSICLTASSSSCYCWWPRYTTPLLSSGLNCCSCSEGGYWYSS